MNISPIVAFFRAATVTALICCCMIGGIWGCMIGYENTVRVGFGEERKAVELGEDGLRFFDLHL